MKFIADLHIHSHFSRATSKNLNPENLVLWAQKKGISVIGTGDFTHPDWISELQDKLIEAEGGLYRLKPELQSSVDLEVPPSCLQKTRFMLSGEISSIYKKGGKTRKVHNLILMPDIDSVLKFNKRLDRIGNIKSDGRPILGLDSRDLLEITLEINDEAFFIPAHIWTPWFSVFGSKSGFDTLEECFEDLTDHIHALETGLSSDPPMNRCVSALDEYLLVSNSDAHSPGKLGREANVFDTDLDYHQMVRTMTDGKGFLGTIEFYPEEGKYHLDGHRKCRIRFQPSETKEHQGTCPECGRPLTVGVSHRIYDLSDRETPILSKDFFSLIPLTEVISEIVGRGPATKTVMSIYEKLLTDLGPELSILLDSPLSDIETAGGNILAEAINRMRRNQVIREGGYDGEFGRIILFDNAEKDAFTGQMALFEKQKRHSHRRQITRPTRKYTKEKSTANREPGLPADPLLDPLNPEQKKAVLHQGDHLLVTAGPGTGKTLTLTHKIAYLLREGMAEADQILALTFTRKAAAEMQQRVLKLVGDSLVGNIRTSTFHGFCLDILRKEQDHTGLPPDFTICSEMDSKALAKAVITESGKGQRITKKFLKALPDLKQSSVLNETQSHEEDAFSALFPKYQQRLRNLGMLDFDDLEVETFRLLRDFPGISKDCRIKFPWVFVDEYQDTNKIQVEILKTIVNPDKSNLCVIGDPDQAIYGFRGADVENFHRFFKDFPGATEIKLTRNYRSIKSILDSSAALMKKPEALSCESQGDGIIFLASTRTESEEAEMIVEQVEKLLGGISHFSLNSGRVDSHESELSLAFVDFGILFRLNTQGDALEEALNRAGIPFTRSGESPLINRFPANIIQRFFQTFQHPDNPYYAEAYTTLLSDTDIKKAVTVEEFRKKTPQQESPLTDLIDLTLKLHNIDCTSEESQEVLRRLLDLAQTIDGDLTSFLDMFSLERGIDHNMLAGDRVALMSIHAAKGLEWPVVFITGCEDKLIPCSLFGNSEINEERRLFYVGMTRARSHLILSHADLRSLNGRGIQMKPSPFLDDIPQDLLKPLDRRGWKPKKRPHKQLSLF